MLPHIDETPSGQFLDVWVDQEQGHARVFGQLQREVGLEPVVPEPKIRAHKHIIGFLGEHIEGVHDLFEWVYLSRGAMHERLTLAGYNLMANKLEALDEKGLTDNIVRPIKSQEAGHLGYYRLASQELKKRLSPWQIWLARKLSVISYSPVGASTESAKQQFGLTALSLAGTDLEQFAEPVQKIAEDLLTSGEEVLPDFVLKSIKHCIDLSLEEAA